MEHGEGGGGGGEGDDLQGVDDGETREDEKVEKVDAKINSIEERLTASVWAAGVEGGVEEEEDGAGLEVTA